METEKNPFGNFRQTMPEAHTVLFCPLCDTQVKKCNNCGRYIGKEMDMYCNQKSVNSEHLCVSCFVNKDTTAEE
jgi:hypothetical protein